MNETLTHVINTLNLIDVHGKDNLNKLLGCILVLEKLMTAEDPNQMLTDQSNMDEA